MKKVLLMAVTLSAIMFVTSCKKVDNDKIVKHPTEVKQFGLVTFWTKLNKTCYVAMGEDTLRSQYVYFTSEPACGDTKAINIGKLEGVQPYTYTLVGYVGEPNIIGSGTVQVRANGCNIVELK